VISLRVQRAEVELPRLAVDLGLRPDGVWGRWWQVVIAAVGLVLLLPVSLAIALATKLTSRGPILYRGSRIGRNLTPFTIYKFRTLLVNAEQRIGARLLSPDEPLYTPIGRFLKRTKLDEIPQLLNVLAGQMNMVGPRPIRPIFLATSTREIANYTARFIVRPGMTGLAQLRGGYFTHPRDKLRYDLLYIRNRSVWFDARLVLATFVKLLNRWLTLGAVLALIFLCASFVPTIFKAPFEVPVGGFNLSPFEALGLLLAATTLVRQIPSHRLYLYRSPTNLPMACFIAFSVLAGLWAGDLVPRLRDAAYFSASGFLIVLLIVSGEVNEGFVIRATRIVALAAVAVSLLGILEIALLTHPTTHQGLLGASATPRITSTLGSPVVLAAYLVLGVPLVLVELAGAERREERDFWLICTTLVIVAVLLTQSRVGLLALWITGSIFTWRVSRQTCWVFAGGTLAVLALMVLTGSQRLSPSSIATEWGRRVSLTGATITTEVRSHRALLGPEPGRGAVAKVPVETPGAPTHLAPTANMHLTLMLRSGLAGWALMMWVIGAALLAIRRGSHLVRDERMARVLWAIFSSGVGFLVSIANFNAFYNPPVQILFWGLLGIGLAIVTHLNGKRPSFNVIYRFGQGD
jgi:lipopolysaccharide/colanic/teichoic acid biosynthesis glycosyltransferase